MSEDALLPGREYAMRIGHDWTVVSVTQIRHKIDVDTGGEAAARVLTFNEIGFCNLSSIRRVALDPYVNHRATGAFILVDRNTNRTCAAGMVAFSLQRAGDIRRETFLVDKEARAQRNGQTPFVLWLTGLSGSGKSTIAKIVEKRLAELGRRTYTLDGDNLRGGLNRDLGFTDADRVENIRRAGQVAKLFVDAGLIVICSFISPFRAERDLVREMLDPGEFIEVFVDTPLEICIERDPKGLYRRARAGLIRNFTGLGSPYERPVAPDLTINTEGQTPEQTAQVVLDWLLVNVPDGTPLSRGLSQ
jgi:bifunctional enzyme CysN/CysC